MPKAVPRVAVGGRGGPRGTQGEPKAGPRGPRGDPWASKGAQGGPWEVAGAPQGSLGGAQRVTGHVGEIGGAICRGRRGPYDTKY